MSYDYEFQISCRLGSNFSENAKSFGLYLQKLGGKNCKKWTNVTFASVCGRVLRAQKCFNNFERISIFNWFL